MPSIDSRVDARPDGGMDRVPVDLLDAHWPDMEADLSPEAIPDGPPPMCEDGIPCKCLLSAFPAPDAAMHCDGTLQCGWASGPRCECAGVATCAWPLGS